MREKEISQAVIRRLPRYHRHLGDLMREGTERISSEALGRRMGITASQIRQDFNNFGGFGQQGYGYNVENLHSEIGKILGLNREHNVAIVGAGNLARALASSQDFAKWGFLIKALFDNNPNVIGQQIAGITVSDVRDLPEVLEREAIDIVALTVPKKEAIKAAEGLVDCGVKAIWNFANFDLQLPESIIVENVHLTDSLMQLSYSLSKTRE